MGEHSVTFVRADALSEPEAVLAVEAAQNWLIKQAVIQPNLRFDELWQPSLWMPGPRCTEFVEPEPRLSGFINDANNGVDLVSDWNAHHPAGNDELPTCL